MCLSGERGLYVRRTGTVSVRGKWNYVYVMNKGSVCEEKGEYVYVRTKGNVSAWSEGTIYLLGEKGLCICQGKGDCVC